MFKVGDGGQSLTHIRVSVETVTFCCFGYPEILRRQETELGSCPLLPPWFKWLHLDMRLGWVSPGGSCVGSFYSRVTVCSNFSHLLFKNALMDCYSRGRKIFHSYVYVIQMVFLKIYFCVFTMFLNNVSISTVKDKTCTVRKIWSCIF